MCGDVLLRGSRKCYRPNKKKTGFKKTFGYVPYQMCESIGRIFRKMNYSERQCKGFYRTLRIGRFTTEYGGLVFASFFGFAALCFIPLAASVSGAFAAGVLSCALFAVLSYFFIPKFAEHRTNAILAERGSQIIKTTVDAVRDLIHSAETDYRFEFDGLFDFYMRRGFFVEYDTKDFDAFMTSLEKNKTYDLQKEISDEHGKRCREELTKAAGQTRDASSKTVLSIVDSLVNVNNLFGCSEPLDKTEILKETQSLINGLNWSDAETERIKRGCEEERIHREELARLREEMARQASTYSGQRPKKYVYRNHCWNCKTPIDGSWNRKCPKCGKFYICPRCGYCKCGFNVRKGL